MVKKTKLTKQQKVTLDNDRYKELIIQQRVSKLAVNNPEQYSFYDHEIDLVNQQIDQRLKDAEFQAKIDEEIRYMTKKGKIEQRFDDVNKGINQVGDIIMDPIRNVEDIAFELQNTAFQITDSVTGILTSPILLIAIGGVAFVLLNK